MQRQNSDSYIEALKQKALEKAEQRDLSEKEMEKVKQCCRRIFTTADGIIVAKAMMKISGIYKLVKNTQSLGEMGAERGKEYMYMFFIKGMLTPEQLSSVERKED